MRLNPKATVSKAFAKLNPELEVGTPPPASYPAVPATPKHTKREEKKLHDQCENMLRQRNLFYLHSRMDKPTTLRKGTPDLIIFLPNIRLSAALLVELKVPGGAISPYQNDFANDYYRQTSSQVAVVWSLEEFRSLLDARMNIE